MTAFLRLKASKPKAPCYVQVWMYAGLLAFEGDGETVVFMRF